MYKRPLHNNSIQTIQATVEYNVKEKILYLKGSWTWDAIKEQIVQNSIVAHRNTALIVDGSQIDKIDTIGAHFLAKLLLKLNYQKTSVNTLILNETAKKIFARVNHSITELSNKRTKKNAAPNIIGLLGQKWISLNYVFIAALIFFGQFCVNLTRILRQPLQIGWQEVSRTIFTCGLKGVGVSILLNFLIGITLAYEMSPQFITYGANVYIVNFLGIALLKEVSPLLTAIITAGRTGSSITAELGVMKVQEEIDALKTMGITPMQRLIFPKVFGVVIALPLITAISDLVSMLGGAIIANNNLGVSYSLFIERMQTYVSIYNYTDGIVKSIAFALSISLTGCFCGLSVKGDANSIGEQTTKSVVIGIIMVVILDAIFAIIFKILGI